jgi:hypothetical protein
MPKTIPPPPPQPSQDETVRAVRHVWFFFLLAVGLFWGIASMVGADSFFVEYGRRNGGSWNLKMVADLDEAEARAHPGGAVAWLVGSSMLRDSFDVAVLNAELERRGSRFRARKFGQTRGAAGMSRGVLARLPLAEGDVVLHGMGVSNYRRGWLADVELPDWRVMMMLSTRQILDIEAWSAQTKLETLIARPQTFFEYQEESIEGVARWFYGLVRRGTKPKIPSGLKHTRFLKPKKADRQKTEDLSPGFVARRYLEVDGLDLSSTQFNMQGLDDFRRITTAAGVDLYLFEHTGRAAYKEMFVSPEVQAVWSSWYDAQPEAVHFPQPKEDGFYDLTHPNAEGRAMLTAYLVDWLAERPKHVPNDWVKIWSQAQQPQSAVIKGVE